MHDVVPKYIPENIKQLDKMQLVLLIVSVLVFLSHHEHEAIAAYVPPYTSVVAPINKHIDAAVPLYSVNIMTRYTYPTYMHTNFLLDTDAPLIWHTCILQWNTFPDSCPNDTICTYPVSCQEYVCTDVRTSYSYQSSSCPPLSNSSTLPGWGDCTCPVDLASPTTGSCGQGNLNYDVAFTLNTCDGRNPLSGEYSGYPNAACVSDSFLQSFPANVSGVMALSSSPYALPAYLYQPLKKTLALCLPSSTSAPGVLFFGTGPYYLRPQSDVDLTGLLSYTPLLSHPNSFGYFIGVKAILVNGKAVYGLSKDNSTKLSTLTPYTILRKDVYDRFLKGFSKAANQFTRVDPIQPFGLCYNTSNVGHTRVGLRVPHVGLYLQNGVKWTIFGANSMKQITKDVACLAFVDGGLGAEHAIVIGTQQIEDNFLTIDLTNSTMGFSSSLLYRKTSCSNFNFTTGVGNP